MYYALSVLGFRWIYRTHIEAKGHTNHDVHTGQQTHEVDGRRPEGRHLDDIEAYVQRYRNGGRHEEADDSSGNDARTVFLTPSG